MILEMLKSVPLWIGLLVTAVGALHYFFQIKLVPNLQKNHAGVLALVGLLITGVGAGYMDDFIQPSTTTESTVDWDVTASAGQNFQFDSDGNVFTVQQEYNTSSDSIMKAVSVANFDISRSDTSASEAVTSVELVNNPELENDSTDKSYPLIKERADGTPMVKIIDQSDSTYSWEQRNFAPEQGSTANVQVNVTWNGDAVQYGLEQFDSSETMLKVGGEDYTLRELYATQTN